MRSTTVRRGNGGSRASRYRWGALGIQCSSRCLNSLETLVGLFAVTSFGGPALDASDGVSEADPPRLTGWRSLHRESFPPLTSLSRPLTPRPGSTPERSTLGCRSAPTAPRKGCNRKRIGTPSVVFGHARFHVRGLLSSRLFGSASRHGAPVRSSPPLRVRQRARRASSELGLATVFRCAAAIRPTDFCHLFHLIDLHSRSRFSAS